MLFRLTFALFLLVIALVCVFGVNGEEEEGSKNLQSALEESEVLKLLRDQSAKQDRALEDLQRRLNKELNRMEAHFEEMFAKVKTTEQTLEDNLKQVEKKVLGQVDEIQTASDEKAGSWFWPFIFLMCIVAAAGGFFVYMYQKATKHSHFL